MIDGVRIGHWSDPVALTGCTVVLPPPETVGSVWIAGGAPATHETDLLGPAMRIEIVDALLLTGGSAFGLSAFRGVMGWLEERDIGHDAGVARVPIVPAAAIFDLGLGDAHVRPGEDEGRAACEAAVEGASPEGNVGAGAGATVGKAAGWWHQTKGGLGVSLLHRDGIAVAAVAVVNAYGDVIGADGRVIAGRRGPLPEHGVWIPPASQTTLACVLTDAILTKEQAYRVARTGAAGLARSVRPVFTMFDGDVVFTLATRARPASPEVVEIMAADAVAEAVRRGVLAAESVAGAPACTTPEGAPHTG